MTRCILTRHVGPLSLHFLGRVRGLGGSSLCSFIASPYSFLPYFAIHPSPYCNSPIFYLISAPTSLALPPFLSCSGLPPHTHPPAQGKKMQNLTLPRRTYPPIILYPRFGSNTLLISDWSFPFPLSPTIQFLCSHSQFLFSLCLLYSLGRRGSGLPSPSLLLILCIYYERVGVGVFSLVRWIAGLADRGNED